MEKAPLIAHVILYSMSENTSDKDVRRTISRRSLLKGLGVIGLGAVTGLISPRDLLSERTHKITTDSGALVELNERNLPLRCILPDNKTVNFDPKEVEKIRAEAISSQEPGLFTVLRLPIGSVHSPYDSIPKASVKESEDHSVAELPKDTLSEAELKEKGIEIIQAGATSAVKLYVRQGAFEEGEPLSSFDKNGRKLTIALIDAPLISSEALEDPRYESIRDRIEMDYKGTTENYIKGYIEEFQKPLVGERRQYLLSHRDEAFPRIGSPGDEYYKGLKTPGESYLLRAKRDLFIFENNLLSEADMMNIMEIRGFFAGSLGDAKGALTPSKDSPVILMGVGEGTRPRTDAIMFYFTPSGELGTFEMDSLVSSFSSTGSNMPDRSQGFLNPANYTINASGASPSEPNSYPWQAVQTPGFILRHEIEHDVLIDQSTPSNGSEYDTDIGAMNRIKKARDKFEATGDTSGYYFAFSLPEGRYILT